MSDVAIQVENLSKQYVIGTAKIRHDTLRDQVAESVRGLFRRNGQPSSDTDTIWALKDVCFEVKQGEVLGIIGRNGAGKSTLLKILSRITEPSSGSAKVYGRLASLLEVGTGFHGELTGRENIYLNGAVLGMKKAEIDRKLDEIIAFAEIEKFMDTPVKRYSSGMYVRLAFAVAAHLEPDILIVDEVLAVGDVAFQKKCLGKMGDVAKAGRTVLLVSHNVSALLNLSHRAVLLDSGRLVQEGQTNAIVGRYLASNYKDNSFQLSNAQRLGDQRATIEHFEIRPTPPRTGAPLDFIFSIRRSNSRKTDLLVNVAVCIYTEIGAPLLQLHSRDMGLEFAIPPGKTQLMVSLEKLPLVAGRYRLDLWMGSGEHHTDYIEDCFRLCVDHGSLDGNNFVEENKFPVLVPAVWRKT